MLAWYYLAGRSPEQLVIDLFAQHQRVAVCFSVKWLLTFDAPNEKDQKRVENHLGLHSEKKQLITQCLYQRLPSFTKNAFLTFQSAKKSAIFTDLLLCYAEHGPNQIEIAESNFILIRQYISWALTTYHVSYRVHNKLKPFSVTSNSVGSWTPSTGQVGQNNSTQWSIYVGRGWRNLFSKWANGQHTANRRCCAKRSITSCSGERPAM